MKTSKNPGGSALVTAPNRFQENFGNNPNSQKVEEVNRILQGFMGEIRVLLGQPTDSPCRTCAFNPTTDAWQGFILTTYNLMWAISHDKLFLCHQNQSDWKNNRVDLQKIELCRGFVYIMTAHRDTARKLAQEAETAIHEVFK